MVNNPTSEPVSYWVVCTDYDAGPYVTMALARRMKKDIELQSDGIGCKLDHSIVTCPLGSTLERERDANLCG